MVLTFDVIRRTLTLGDRDATTGWRTKNYTESTIEMIVIPKGATNLAMMAGVYVRLDATGLTVDPVEIGDEIKSGDVYYEVKTVKEHFFGDSFMWRECDLTELPLHE